MKVNNDMLGYTPTHIENYEKLYQHILKYDSKTINCYLIIRLIIVLQNIPCKLRKLTIGDLN